MTVPGNPVVHGHNAEGLPARLSRERITRVKQMHRLLYRDGLTPSRRARPRRGGRHAGAEADADVQMLLDFLAASTRGIAR
jgi:UDP-N-acetylglucosamine acyltransferase